jgi:tetratricopeptide (TPR) repeat protein
MHIEARCLVMLGRDKTAHQVYMELARLDAGNPAIWIEFGTLAWRLGDYRRLAQCGSRTVALAPDRYEGYMLQGLYERKHGNIENAVESLGRSVELAPKMVVPYLMLGEALEEAGNPRAAFNVYNAALELEPSNRNARARHDELKKALKIASAE